MAFLETPRFPLDINYGSKGGPTFNTSIIQLGNGSEARNANWSLPLYEYDIGYSIKTRTQLMEVYELFLACRGALDGFRAKDVWDFSSASNGKAAPAITDQLIGTGDGSTTAYQLVKSYTQGANSLSRTIKKPVSGTILIQVNGVPKTEGVGYTVDLATGIITLTTPPTAGHEVKAGFQFDVPVRFKDDNILSALEMVTYGTSEDIGALPAIALVEMRNP